MVGLQWELLRTMLGRMSDPVFLTYFRLQMLLVLTQAAFKRCMTLFLCWIFILVGDSSALLGFILVQDSV